MPEYTAVRRVKHERRPRPADVDLKEGAWTLIASNWPVQKAFNPDDKTALYGSGGYTPDKDVLRARSPSGSRLVCLRNR